MDHVTVQFGITPVLSFDYASYAIDVKFSLSGRPNVWYSGVQPGAGVVLLDQSTRWRSDDVTASAH